MGTTNAQGLYVYDNNDSISPISSYMNLQGSALTARLAQDASVRKVANSTQRAAYVTQIGLANITAANPLLVWRADAPAGQRLEYTYNGTTWHSMTTSEYQNSTFAQIRRAENTLGRTAIVNELNAAGLAPAASNPLYVHRADAPSGLNLERTTDGTNWQALPTYSQTTVPGISAWSASSVTVVRVGNLVTMSGIISNGGTIGAGTANNSNIMIVPGGLRPAGTVHAAASGWISGHVLPYTPRASVVVISTGNVSINTESTLTNLGISMSWIAA